MSGKNQSTVFFVALVIQVVVFFLFFFNSFLISLLDGEKRFMEFFKKCRIAIFFISSIGLFHVKWTKAGHNSNQNWLKLCLIEIYYELGKF